MKTTVIILGIVIVTLLGALVFVNPSKAPESGSPGMAPLAESADGHVRVSYPAIGEAVASPLVVSGVVIGGGWFFEGVFPVRVLDANGAVIGQAQARAEGDWTSSGTVPFSATVPFSLQKSGSGMLLLEKDNPSGIPQNASDLRVPITFR